MLSGDLPSMLTVVVNTANNGSNTTESQHLNRYSNETEMTFGKGVQMTIEGVLGVLIIFSNSLVICAVRRHASLQTVTNYFIVSLAVADLLVGLVLPVHVTFLLFPQLSWHTIGCMTRLGMFLLPCSGSLFSLLLIAVDRHQAILYPLHYQSRMTPALARCIICVGWVFSLTLTTLSIYFNRYGPQEQRQGCHYHTVLKPMAVWICFGHFIMVVTVMLALYGCIFCVAYRHIRHIGSMERRESTTSQTTTNFIREMRTAATLAIVMGGFICTWLPFQMVAFLKSVGVEVWAYDKIYQYCVPILMTNSCINPVIYAWRNTSFRVAFKRLLGRSVPDL